jgi:predicted transcriptional regulator YdeE
MHTTQAIPLDAFTIIGISVRTTNKDGQSANDIGQLWQQFIGENLVARIPGKLSSEIYCIYTDYESDFTGAYTTYIGCRVDPAAAVPEGFVRKDIPQANYQRIESRGKLPDCVAESWMAIWQSEIDRAYLADFDVYGEGCKDPQNAMVEIYLSVR